MVYILIIYGEDIVTEFRICSSENERRWMKAQHEEFNLGCNYMEFDIPIECFGITFDDCD